jgi:hypothetical protein
MTGNLFPDHTDWTEATCYYVAAFHRTRVALVAGPYRTAAAAERVRPAAQDWAVHSSGDPAEADYVYVVHGAWNGRARSILGGWEPPPTGDPTPFNEYAIVPRRRTAESDELNRALGTPCDPADAQVWTLYGRVPGEGIEAVGDFASRAAAEEVYARITGKSYGG